MRRLRSASFSWGVLAGFLATLSARAETPEKVWKYLAHELVMPEGKFTDEKRPKQEQKLFAVVEDAETESGKALEIKVDKRLVREQEIDILATPGIPRAEAPPGLYRVTVRLKLAGMLNVIGTPILFGRTRLYGYMFKEEDAYKEFTLLEEVIEPDHVSWRPKLPGPEGALGQSPWRLDGLRRMVEVHTSEGHENEYPALEKDGWVWKKYGWGKLQDGRDERALWYEGKSLQVRLAFGQTTNKGKKGAGVFGNVANSIQSVSVDWLKIERVAESPSITVRQVRPRKTWVRPGETQTFHVWMHNRSGRPQTGELSLALEHGLNTEQKLAAREVTVPDGAYRVERVLWEVPAKQPIWGHRVIARFLQGRAVHSQAEEVFTVHPNPWAVMIHGGATFPANPYYEPLSYRNYVEYFGVSPGDSIQPYPDRPDIPYLTGMSGYATLMDLQKVMTDWNRQIGMATFMYLSPLADSHRAETYYLKHPEWYSNRISWTDQAMDQWVTGERLLAEAWLAGKPHPEIPDRFHIETGLNFNYDELVRHTIEGSVKAIDHVGYEGIRGDGLPMSLAGMNSLGEATGPKDWMDRKRASGELLRRMRSRIREKHPKFVWGSNGDLYGVMQSLISRNTTPPKIEDCPDFIAMLEGGNAEGGSLMDEGWMSAYLYQDPRNTIKDYFWACRQECDFCRQAGGFFHTFSPERDGTGYFIQSIIYYNLLTALAGAQYPGFYSPTPGSDTGTAHFLTRFCEFLWDCELKWLRDAAAKIRVTCPSELWFEETVVWKDLPDGRRRYVIPLVNPPTVERFFKDRFSELPEPVTEPFPMEVELPEGFGTAEVWMLTAEPRTASVRLEHKIRDRRAVFQIPSLVLYRVVVVEFAK